MIELFFPMQGAAVQARAFMTAAKDHPLGALSFLTLTTSLHQGEVLGLMGAG